MPTSDNSANLMEIKIQPEACKTTQDVNGEGADLAGNVVCSQPSVSVDAKGINAGQVETHNVASIKTNSSDVSRVSNGQTGAGSPAVPEQATNSQILPPSTCKAQPAIMSKPPPSVSHSISTQQPVIPATQITTNVLNPATTVQAFASTMAPKVVLGASQLATNSSAIIKTKVFQSSTAVTSMNSQPVFTVNTPGQAGVGISLAPASQPGLVATTSVAPASKVTRVATITQTPGKGAVISVPRVTTPQQNGAQLTPQKTTVQLPANFQIPQGMVLIRSDSGQLMLVSQQALAQAQAQGLALPRMPTATSTNTVRVTATQNPVTTIVRKSETVPTVKPQPQPNTSTVTSLQRLPVIKPTGGAVSATGVQEVRPTAPTTPTSRPVPLIIPAKIDVSKTTPAAQTTISAETLENVKKCKNFLVTLIKLASSGTHSAEMAKNVKELVKNLLDGKIEPEEFTDRLYTELKSSPQPYLVPFLKRSLPAVRHDLSLQDSQVIQQPRGVVIKQSVTTVPSLLTTTLQNRFPQNRPLTTTLHTGLHSIGTILRQPPPQGHKFISVQTPLVHRSNFKENAAAAFRDEDDINDVASMAGVNLSEENARILATNSELVGSVIRSCRDEPFILTATLQKIILEIGKRHGVTDVSSDVVNLVSHATQERLRELIEKLTVVAHHRKISYKDSDHYTHCNETRLQLKFLEQLDRLEKQRKDEEEREMLLRAAKSRANKEDPEQLRLKQKAKEMQQLEMAQMQQRDANLTALAAIGPRKKRPLDSLGYGSGSEGAAAGGTSLLSKQASIQRTTRASLRDLIFCMEQEPSLRQSVALYRALLK
ncbi:transcription initiation factor TFIID subunit 4 [Amia ocellicauda]|uniref:transcription initiation factor TFIID subunit 4 n=1 Tax=Amia ocellicauda TaxID=2972642 RepID=UPI003463F97A